jgi:hypothetical protein
MIERVQVFTPVYRLEPETVAAVLALEWSGPIVWLFQRDNPAGEGRRSPPLVREGASSDGRVNILHQYQAARARFLAGDDDALMIIESDIIPPPDALRRLAALAEQGVDVAYGVYRFRTTEIINVFERYPGEPRNEGESLSIHPAKLAAARRRGVTPCSGGGLGCALIQRRVLERIEFRIEETAYCDTYFNRDVLRAGFRQAADMNVVCGHKDEQGNVLWPF